MFKKSYIVVIALLVTCLMACTEKQKQTSGEPVPVFIEMSKQDTTDVLNLVNEYLGYLTDGRVDDALGMIKVLDGDSIKDVPAEMLKKQRSSLTMLHPIRYEIEHYIFQFETDCIVKYRGILFDKEKDDPTPNTVSYLIRPVRRDHTWYLTLADSEDINTINSEIPN